MAKLVRDKIPERITKSGRVPVTHIAPDEEYKEGLKNKLQEEFKEFFESESDEEMADIMEVIYAICDYKKFNMKKLELLRKKKAEERGRFKKRIILDEVR